MSFQFKLVPIVACFFFSIALSAQTAQLGEAAYYNDDLHGRPTATGELYDKNKLTCAHKTLPAQSIIKVTRLDNGKSVRVRVNDCGPHTRGRIVDLSRAAAEKIDLVWDGVATVKIDVIKLGTGNTACDTRPSNAEPKSYAEVGERINVKGVPEPAAAVVENGMVAPVINGTFRAEALRSIDAGYAVQVASFTKFANTAAKAEELQKKGFKDILINTDGENYRVLLGPFDTEASANNYLNSLIKKYKIKGFTVNLGQL